MAGLVEDQVDAGREESVWSNVAWFVECSFCKIDIGDPDGVAIPDLLARDLAEDNIVPTGYRDDKSRSSFNRRQVGERKRYNDDIPLYKSRQIGNLPDRKLLTVSVRSMPLPPRAGASLSGARVHWQGRYQG